MKKIIREILLLLWKLLRTYALRWLRQLFGRFAKIGVAVALVGFFLMTAFVLLLSSGC